MRFATTCLILSAAFLGWAPGARADLISPISFVGVSKNSLSDVAAGCAQLHLDVSASEYSSTQVTFKFTNDESVPMVISEVYFYGFYGEDLWKSEPTFDSSSGVKFVTPAVPKDLPDYPKSLPQTLAYSVGAVPPEAKNGVGEWENGVGGPGEWLTVTFDLKEKTYEDTLAALGNETLVVGIHVKCFEKGGSESFINGVPEPSILTALVGLALTGMAMSFRRRRRAA